MREGEVSVAAAMVEGERVKITEERKAMTNDFKAKMESLNKKVAELQRCQRDCFLS